MNKPEQETIELKLSIIISDEMDSMFERFDQLHKVGINDDDVIRYLRKEDYPDLADAYIEWSGAVDPDSDEDNTTMNPDAVTDPGDAPSYTSLDEALGTTRKDDAPWSATPGELTAELTAAGINADNLEQALIDAYKENRIDHGIFYAERSNDGLHWHVYKKRSHEDNGAYIATVNHREGAQLILDALGTGTTNHIDT